MVTRRIPKNVMVGRFTYSRCECKAKVSLPKMQPCTENVKEGEMDSKVAD